MEDPKGFWFMLPDRTGVRELQVGEVGGMVYTVSADAVIERGHAVEALRELLAWVKTGEGDRDALILSAESALFFVGGVEGPELPVSAGDCSDLPPYEDPFAEDDEAPAAPDLQAQYDEKLALVLRLGSFLTGTKAQLLPRAEWETEFARYEVELTVLRDLGEQLRPPHLTFLRHLPPAGILDDHVRSVRERLASA